MNPRAKLTLSPIYQAQEVHGSFTNIIPFTNFSHPLLKNQEEGMSKYLISTRLGSHLCLAW